MDTLVERIFEAALSGSGAVREERMPLPINTARPEFSPSNPPESFASHQTEHFFNYLFYLKLHDRIRHGQK
jgi:hypothetical protein